MTTDARMNLQRLIDEGIIIEGVTNDSRQVKPGDLFLAYPGDFHDGRNYIAQAIENGAVAVLWESNGFHWPENWTVINYPVAALKAQASNLAATVYDHPSRKMSVVGVTGTNGKTSISQWIAQAMGLLGGKSAVIGTLGMGTLNHLKPSSLTTPDAVCLQRTLAGLAKENVDLVAMEVSSIGIEEGRVDDVDFRISVLTNISRDHLDYHKTMEAYEAAKQKLFTWPTIEFSVLNLDDPFGLRLAQEIIPKTIKVFGYTLHPERALDRAYETIWLEEARDTETGQRLALACGPYRSDVEIGLLGRFNAANILAVVAVLLAMEYSWESIMKTLPLLTPPSGRMERIALDTPADTTFPMAIVDYAHTPDALEQALTVLKPVARCRGGKLWVVFGCGGDRDKGKRPMMGAIAARMADRVLVTDDNPRFESPSAIREEIIKGLAQNDHLVVIEGRENAIKQAIKQANTKDVILVAGKGHENYQEIEGIKHSFSDTEVIKTALQVRLAS